MGALDNWEPEAASVLAILVGASLLAFATRLWSYFVPGGVLEAGIIIYVAAAGLVTIAVGAADGIDVRPHAKLITTVVASIIAGTLVVFYLNGIETAAPGPDAILFSQWSVELLLNGKNPYVHSMAPAWNAYNASALSRTPRADGTYVTSLSYPAGSVLVFLPQRLIGSLSFRKTVGVLSFASFVFLIAVAPDEYALVPIPLFIAMRLFHQSWLGIIDAIWLLPTLVAMWLWYLDRRIAAAVALGLAASMKQQPWMICPFLAIWLYYDADSYHVFAVKAGQCLAAGVGTFLTINSPFIIWSLKAWLDGILTPLNAGAAPMVIQGMGLSMLSVNGIIGLTKGFYTVLFASTIGWALIIYAVYFERLRWAGWFAPALLLFVNYRSLLNYFTFYVPIGYLAALCAYDAALHEFPTPTLQEVSDRVATE